MLTSIFENRVQLDAAALFLLAFHVNLELGFTPRHPISLDSVCLLGIPATTTGLLTDRRGMSKGIGGQFAEIVI